MFILLDAKAHRVEVKVTYPNLKTDEMSFVRYNLNEAFKEQ